MKNMQNKIPQSREEKLALIGKMVKHRKTSDTILETDNSFLITMNLGGPPTPQTDPECIYVTLDLNN
jgi:hypothetical protein